MPDAPRVLVVERDAHLRAGHFPNRFAALAAGFAARGCDVEVLTQQGWLLAHEGQADGFPRHRFPWLLRHADRIVLKARRRVPNALVWGACDALSTLFGAIAVRVVVRRRRPDLVVVLSYDTLPALLAAVLGDTRVVVYAFSVPMRWTERVDVTARRIRSRRVAIAAPTPGAARAWSARHPHATVAVAPIAGVTPTVALPRHDARRSLGLGVDERVVLLFGSGHDDFDTAVVRRAFELEALDDLRLVVGGKVARHYDGWQDARVVRAPGFVSSAQRDRLFAAADVVILSFVDGYDRDSGTLMDAVSYGRPVVASRGSLAADIVKEYRLGVLFTPGDERSLVHALRQVPAELDPGVLARARAERSDAEVARRLLGIARIPE